MRVVWPWDLHILGVERVNQRLLRSMLPVPNPIARARIYEAALSRAGQRSYAEVAVEFGVTREEVCQYVTLVRRLPEDMVAAVEGEQGRAPGNAGSASGRCSASQDSGTASGSERLSRG